MLVKLEIIPMFRGENKKYVKRPAIVLGVISPHLSVESPTLDFLSCQETRFAAVWEAKLHETQRWLALPLKYLISLSPKKAPN